MCGIVGFWGGADTDSLGSNLRTMAHQLFHRGPDSYGFWMDAASRIGLAHRRLSIVDLSPAGSQPMHSPCNRYVLIYNGEIYNHVCLRSELASEGGAFNWRGYSDTETLMAALCHWGVGGALKRLNGMFAFALWDTANRILFLARDRMGEKPLYYGRSGATFLFGSELKSLSVHSDWNAKISRDSLALYMQYGYVPAPWCIYGGISKLLPAHFVAISDDGYSVGEPVCYWSLADVAMQDVANTTDNPDELIGNLDSLLSDSVKQRMVADVPLGAFLSGGYDSSTVVSLMQANSMKPVKTFSVGFFEESYNESCHAKKVADHLGTEHTELYITPKEAMEVIPRLPIIYDEPFSDSSQIPTLLISQLARKHVTVALSGDGGDELFCGYNRYTLGYQAWQRLQSFSPKFRHAMVCLLSQASVRYVDKLQKMLPQRFKAPILSNLLLKFAETLAHSNGLDYYKAAVSHWKKPNEVVLQATEADITLDIKDELSLFRGMREYMMYLDMVTYLPDDILTKVDRASMAVSLEVRVPLLDHRLVEFACRVPIEYKYRDRQGKWLLRQLLYRYVPQELMDRPKMGFGVPIEHWLRGPLKDWAESLLSEQRLREAGFFNPLPIRKMWGEHISVNKQWHYQLWDVLMFQSWLQEQRG